MGGYTGDRTWRGPRSQRNPGGCFLEAHGQEDSRMKAYVSLTNAGLRSFFRDRTALFWSFFFPVFFIVIFGSIFSNSDKRKGEKPFTVGIVLEDKTGSSSWV